MPGPKELKRRAMRKMAKQYSLEYCAERLQLDPLGCARIFLISQGKDMRQMRNHRVQDFVSYPKRAHLKTKAATT